MFNCWWCHWPASVIRIQKVSLACCSKILKNAFLCSTNKNLIKQLDQILLEARDLFLILWVLISNLSILHSTYQSSSPVFILTCLIIFGHSISGLDTFLHVFMKIIKDPLHLTSLRLHNLQQSDLSWRINNELKTQIQIELVVTYIYW
jgi:hypothetical protein